MRKLAYILFILVVLHTNACAQASKSYIINHIVNKTIDKGEYVDDKRIDKKDKIHRNNLIYILSPKKDSIAFYRFTDSQVSEKKVPDVYTLTKNENTLLLTSKNESYTNKLKIAFNEKDKTILVGEKDVFYLNDPYFSYLQKNVNEYLNIPDLIDFLEDFLPGYNFGDLKYISSYEKYKHKDFKILKGYMESYRTQASDYLDKWNLKFLYNDKGMPTYVLKESVEGDRELEKKMISSNNGSLKYTLHTNIESRLITDSEIFIDINKNIYDEKVTSVQVGLGKETRYEIKQLSYKRFPTNGFTLNSANIAKVISSK
ncbi:hypothetical protein F3J23_15500 [Chryseobacterium sp. Tr-659]|uniref:hypothetical protein n=1 Tax=Chryseobacterium sp. Tr-659 TaxID=2608340 RepID=UPI00141E1D2E|nr:hypothetical protein [Chryseobacterium sp. Tr-659]NIF06851.1 hypothetical protein [Chryseobacterium sp. Tr-659]